MREEDDLDLAAWSVPPPPDDLVERATLAATAPPPAVSREAISPPARGLRTAITVFAASMGGAAVASAFWAWVYFTEPRVIVTPEPVPIPQMLPMDHAAEVTAVVAPVITDPEPASDVDDVISKAAIAACSRNDHDAAMRYLFALTGDRKANALEVCRRSGITP